MHKHVHVWRAFTLLVTIFLLSNQSMNNWLLYLLWPTKDRSSASSKFLAVFCNLRGQIPKVSKEQSTCMCKRHLLSNRSSRVACVRCLVKCMLEIGNLYLCLNSDEGLMIKMWSKTTHCTHLWFCCLWIIHLCLSTANCAQNHVITYTNVPSLHLIINFPE